MTPTPTRAAPKGGRTKSSAATDGLDLHVIQAPANPAAMEAPQFESGAESTARNPLDLLGGPVSMGIRRSISTLVHLRLRTAILNAQLTPGAAISETELASHLQVSRTPIREAMQKLAAEGLVSVVPQVGTFVTRMNLSRIREALFMREAVESAALLRLPMPLAPEHIARLKQLVATHLAAAKAHDVNAVLGSDDSFHRYLLELAGVPGTWKFVLEARETHRRVRVLAHTEFDSARRSANQHGEIVTALAAGKPEKAAEIMRHHIRMNEQFAESMAERYPAYFVDGVTGQDLDHP